MNAIVEQICCEVREKEKTLCSAKLWPKQNNFQKFCLEKLIDKFGFTTKIMENVALKG